MTKPFRTDIINHRGEEITVNTFIDGDWKVTEEFTRKGFKFVLSGEGRVLTMYANGTPFQAISKDLVTYKFNGKAFKVSEKYRNCDTVTEMLDIIDVADWMIAQF